MKVTARHAIPIAALAVAASGAMAIGAASAAESAQAGSLAQKIASTFHLDANKVQEVINTDRDEHQAAREQAYEDRLNTLMKDGKITQSQKDAILSEHKKLLEKMKSAKTLDASQRHTLMKEVRTEAKTWAEQNQLDEKYLLGPGLGHRHMSGLPDRDEGHTNQPPMPVN